jgi:hypothetical protein
MKTKTTHLSCTCGAFCLEVHGTPIISAECHCKSCSDAARRLETLPVPEAIRTIHGGTRYVLYRKDRISLLAGTENLREFRLAPKSPCRNSLMSRDASHKDHDGCCVEESCCGFDGCLGVLP